MTSFDSAFARSLYARIAETHRELSGRIMTPGAIKNFEEYQNNLVRISMLDLVIEMMSEEHKRLVNPTETP